LGYWSQRLKKIPTISNTTFKLLKKQKGKCALCREEFRHGDTMEIDHIRPLSTGGKKTTGNIQLVHRHCHHKKASLDRI
jgi:RNA-directed DNA polymerase